MVKVNYRNWGFDYYRFIIASIIIIITYIDTSILLFKAEENLVGWSEQDVRACTQHMRRQTSRDQLVEVLPLWQTLQDICNRVASHS